MGVLYTAEALAIGDGRNGRAYTLDGKLDVVLSIPTEMGGSGDGTNPEQLFAAGYAGCFHSALRATARRTKADVTDSTVGAQVGIGPDDSGGYSLSVTLEVSLPHLSRADAEELVALAHQGCPYSNATRGNIDVQISIKNH